MGNIGIVGSGIAGLQLGLFLQQRGLPVTLYSDRTPEEIRAGRLPNAVARFDHTQERDRSLGVHRWDDPEIGALGAHFRIVGDQPLAFYGSVRRPASFVDMRIYLSTLLEEFAARGGPVRVGALQAADVARLSANHDLMVVASGRGSLTEMFPRLPERSPYTRPQRRLCVGLFRGIAYPEPRGLTFSISPGHGEVFQAPFFTFSGMVSSVLFEAIPGRGLEPIVDLRYEDDPARFEATVLSLLREHAPFIYERVDHREFGLVSPLDLLQGAITPTVRRCYAPLSDGKYAVAVGDVHIVNDPLLGQGANAASHAAWTLGEAILAAGAFDESFCRRVEERIWAVARHPTEWTNAVLQPPPPHALAVFAAAAQNRAVADEIVDNFGAPERNWAIFGSPEGAAAFLHRHGVDVAMPAAA
jgi:2-polyprenyl-6-methoxyphenol hydroxylase-like FAD-dependent oxidoreductase